MKYGEIIEYEIEVMYLNCKDKYETLFKGTLEELQERKIFNIEVISDKIKCIEYCDDFIELEEQYGEFSKIPEDLLLKIIKSNLDVEIQSLDDELICLEIKSDNLSSYVFYINLETIDNKDDFMYELNNALYCFEQRSTSKGIEQIYKLNY